MYATCSRVTTSAARVAPQAMSRTAALASAIPGEPRDVMWETLVQQERNVGLEAHRRSREHHVTLLPAGVADWIAAKVANASAARTRATFAGHPATDLVHSPCSITQCGCQGRSNTLWGRTSWQKANAYLLILWAGFLGGIVIMYRYQDTYAAPAAVPRTHTRTHARPRAPTLDNSHCSNAVTCAHARASKRIRPTAGTTALM